MVTDHLGTPKELVTEDGKHTAWSGQLDTWGKARNDPEQEPAYGKKPTPKTDCPIRFQGQWEDAESGLHYNRHRYYDPDAAQYISPDPIGLAGGTNPQAYVSDPSGWVDPLGLAGCPSAILAKKMTDSGTVRPDDTAAHHVVGESSVRAQPARDILNKHNIDINSSENGVFLPNRNNVDTNVPGILHNGRHPNNYIDSVNSRIDVADQIGGKQGVLNELSLLNNELLAAPRDASWRTVINP